MDNRAIQKRRGIYMYTHMYVHSTVVVTSSFVLVQRSRGREGGREGGRGREGGIG